MHRKAEVASSARKYGEDATVGGLFRNLRHHAHRAVAGLKMRGVAPPALVSKTSTDDLIPALVADGVCGDRPVATERERDKSLALLTRAGDCRLHSRVGVSHLRFPRTSSDVARLNNAGRLGWRYPPGPGAPGTGSQLTKKLASLGPHAPG